jgi:hypothetical protein
VPDLSEYLKKVKNERDSIIQTTFWAEYEKGIKKLRKKASHNCETYDDVAKYQGEIQGYDRVLTLPDKLIPEEE